VIAWAAIIASSSRLRWLVIAHPIITLAAIVLTANHYWLDAVVATFLFGFALGFDWAIERRRAKRLAARVTFAEAEAELATECGRPQRPPSPAVRPAMAPRRHRSVPAESARPVDPGAGR
jgi:hypothetical protein